MSKELECLDRIDKRNYLTEREHKEFLGVVEKAIKEYEAIKNANPSEALECLETIWCDISTNYINEYVAIKQALIQKSKKEQAWDIVVEKDVDMWDLADLLEQTYEMYVAFCKSEKYEEDYILTEDEFNLLKEALV